MGFYTEIKKFINFGMLSSRNKLIFNESEKEIEKLRFFFQS